MEVNATFPGAFHRLSAAIMVSFLAYPLSTILQYKFIILFTFLSLPQFLASPVIFTNWGKQGVTIPSPLKEHHPRCSIYQHVMHV
jgi:hypothetical protein